MIKFKFNVAAALQMEGMTAYKARVTGVLSQDTWRKIKNNNANISMESLNRICAILKLQPEHIIYYEKVSDEEKEILDKFGRNRKRKFRTAGRAVNQ